MLKRRRRIAKYVAALTRKKRALTAANVDRLKLEENEGSEGEADKRVQQMRHGTSIPRLTFSQDESPVQEERLWHDSDEQGLPLPNRNMFKKLQMVEEPSQKQYEERLRSFYNSKYGLHNWAVEGEGQIEEDLTDILNHEEVYQQGLRPREPISVQFLARSTEKHASVVTGLDFKNNIVASCGLDQKLRLWSVNAQETNPELRVKLEKDVYAEGYSLTGCFFRGGQVVLGTLRQNYLVVDCEKWRIKHVGSSFLNDHPRFQNIRASSSRDKILLFSQNRLSILDHRNTYQGSLLSAQPLIDAQLAQDHYVFGISNDATYQWDIRNWRMVDSNRDCLANTKLWTHGNTIAIGSKLGIVRLANISQGLKQYAELSNLVTHVTTLEGNQSGNLLVEGSKWKPNAVRVIDTVSGRCVAGFPTNATKIGLPTAAAFSGRNQMCIGNSHGYLHLFEVGAAK